MKKTVFLSIVLIATIIATGTAFADFRADLVAMKNIDSVWPIDQFHTAIFNKKTIQNKKFNKEFLAICQKYGEIKVQASQKDDLTGQITTKWVPVKIELDKHWLNPAYKYDDPNTGKKQSFPAYREEIQYRLDGQFQTTKKFVKLGKHTANLRGMVFEHPYPQKFAYKVKGLNSADYKIIPPEGNIDNYNPVPSLVGGDLFTYLMALAENHDGKYTWVVSNPGGLTETDSFGAYNYIAQTQSASYTMEWFFICDGKTPFTVKCTRNGDKRELKMFHRLPTGLKYKRLTASQTAPTYTAPQPVAGNPATGVEAKVAVASAMTGSDTTLRENPTDLYEAMYNGKGADGSAMVTVRKFFAPDGTDKKQLLESNDYRVINGQAFKIANGMIADSIVPEEVERLIPGVAKDSQTKGSASAMYQDYLVVGQPLRDKNKCMVEVKIFKNNALVTARQINGCNP